MGKFLNSSIGRLRVVTFLEGVSLIVLVFVAMPMKYMMDSPEMVRYVGMVHGALFVLFAFLALSVTLDRKWPLFSSGWKFLLASFIPFGTFYLDHVLLGPAHRDDSL